MISDVVMKGLSTCTALVLLATQELYNKIICHIHSYFISKSHQALRMINWNVLAIMSLN